MGALQGVKTAQKSDVAVSRFQKAVQGLAQSKVKIRDHRVVFLVIRGGIHKHRMGSIPFKAADLVRRKAADGKNAVQGAFPRSLKLPPLIPEKGGGLDAMFKAFFFQLVFHV